MSQNFDVDIAKFKTNFSKLKKWINDDPKSLQDIAFLDESLIDLSLTVYDAGQRLRNSEAETTRLDTNASADFVKEWRDYENRFEPLLFAISVKSGEEGQFHRVPTTALSDETNWHLKNATAHRSSLSIETLMLAVTVEARKLDPVIAELQAKLEEEAGGDPDESYSVDEALYNWRALTKTFGLDIVGIFRRRQLIPFVYFPRHVAKNYGDDRHHMRANLQRAHEAFVFGGTYAALALMRSVMEETLHHHYRASKGDDLKTKIDRVWHLPSDVEAGTLHDLRELANEALHLSIDKHTKGKPLRELGEEELEKHIVFHLYNLRGLIEGEKY